MGKAQKAQKRKSNEVRNERRRKKRYEDKLNSTKPPRPPNRFILYRTHKQSEYNKNPNLLSQRLRNRDPNSPVGMRELSTVVSEDWANEPSHVKEEWDKIAEQIKLTAPYNKNFDTFGNELKYELNSTEFGTFVNATSTNRQSFQELKNVSVNFIFESSCHTPLEQNSPIQTPEDDPDEIPSTLFNELSIIDEPSLEAFKFDQPMEHIDPRVIGFSSIGVDDMSFFTEEPPMFSPMFNMWEAGDNASLEISENLLEFGSESPFSTQSESPFSTPTDDVFDCFWRC